MRLKHSDRRAHDIGTGLAQGQHHGRTLSARRYVDISRQPRLRELPTLPPPYLEAAVTAAAFIFLLYLILGGA